MRLIATNDDNELGRVGAEIVAESMTRFALGVDGGSTKTVALVADTAGRVAGAGRAGGSNLYGPSPAAALANIAEAVETALRGARITAAALLAGGFSLCGADWPEDIDLFHAELTRRGFGRTVTVVNDAAGGLYAGSADGCGVAVVCGTGAATAARAPDGRQWHAGFWQVAGGSVELAHQALQAVYRADLGIDPPTALTRRILAFYDEASVEEVLHRITRRLAPQPMNAGGIARLLLDEADRGDETARRIVIAHGTALGDGALAAARRVGIEGTAFTLVLAGGVFRHPAPLLADALVARVRTSSPAGRPLRSPFEPVAGALRLALESAGACWDAHTQANLAGTLPSTLLFET